VRRHTGLPTVVIVCGPCLLRGKQRKLAEFDLGPDGPSQTSPTVGAWTTSPDGTDKVHLVCGCKHHVERTREWVLTALASEWVNRLAAERKSATIPL
jgi:hypothetical protein